MVPKNRVTHKYQFDLTTKHLEYKETITWGLFEQLYNMDIKPLLTDKIVELTHRGYEAVNWGNMEDSTPTTYYVPIIIVERYEEETDEEYSTRMKRDETNRINTDKNERLEYLRLKAKYEN